MLEALTEWRECRADTEPCFSTQGGGMGGGRDPELSVPPEATYQFRRKRKPRRALLSTSSVPRLCLKAEDSLGEQEQSTS